MHQSLSTNHQVPSTKHYALCTTILILLFLMMISCEKDNDGVKNENPSDTIKKPDTTVVIEKFDGLMFLIAGEGNVLGNNLKESASIHDTSAYYYNYNANKFKTVKDTIGEDCIGFQYSINLAFSNAFINQMYGATNKKLYIVQTAQRSSACVSKSIVEGSGVWSNADLLGSSIKIAKKAKNKTKLNYSAIIWMQGETDAWSMYNNKFTNISEYKNALKQVIASYRDSLGADIPFCIVETGTLIDTTSTNYAINNRNLNYYSGKIRVAQQEIAKEVPNTYIVYAKTYKHFYKKMVQSKTYYNQSELKQVGKEVAENVNKVISKISFEADKAVEVIAHRGASAYAPENTVAAVKLAWEMGADAAEIDVKLTSDKKLVIIHDDNTLAATGNTKNYVVESTHSDTLRKLDVSKVNSAFVEKYKGEKIPFLSEVVATMPEGKKLFVEIKTYNAAITPYLVAFLDTCKKRSQIVLIGFSTAIMYDVKKKCPDIPCYTLHYGLTDATFRNTLYTAWTNRMDGIDVQYQCINNVTNESLKEFGSYAVGWTVDSKADAKALLKYNVLGVTTNDPNIFK